MVDIVFEKKFALFHSVQVRDVATRMMESQMMKSRGNEHLTWTKNWNALGLALTWSNTWRAKVSGFNYWIIISMKPFLIIFNAVYKRYKACNVHFMTWHGKFLICTVLLSLVSASLYWSVLNSLFWMTVFPFVDFTFEYIQREGLRDPIVFEIKDGLGIE